MPPSASGAIDSLGLEQRLRWAGVPPATVSRLYGVFLADVERLVVSMATDGADPTETELSEAWDAIASSPSASGGADSSPAGVLRVGDVPRPQVPGVLKREADEVREMLRREIVETLDEQLPLILEHQAGSWLRDAVDHGLSRDELEVWFERHVAPEVNRMVGDLVAPSGLEQRTELWLQGYFDSDAFRGSVEDLLRATLAPTLNRSIEEYRRLLDELSPAGGSR